VARALLPMKARLNERYRLGLLLFPSLSSAIAIPAANRAAARLASAHGDGTQTALLRGRR
jgi:hypothetical protein